MVLFLHYNFVNFIRDIVRNKSFPLEMVSSNCSSFDITLFFIIIKFINNKSLNTDKHTVSEQVVPPITNPHTRPRTVLGLAVVNKVTRLVKPYGTQQCTVNTNEIVHPVNRTNKTITVALIANNVIPFNIWNTVKI